MKLYHGSPTGGIAALEPRLSNHGRPYVYLTDDPDLAVLYAHNALTPPNAWFSYFYKDGALHYDEYFPNQLEVLYRGFPGYVYTCEADGLERLDQMPWVYMSREPVPVAECRYIPDLCQELLALIRAGRITLHRFEELSPQRREAIDRIISKEIDRLRLREDPDGEYARFIHRCRPDLL